MTKTICDGRRRDTSTKRRWLSKVTVYTDFGPDGLESIDDRRTGERRDREIRRTAV